MFGVLAVNKPAGLTSRDVVNRIQRLVRPAKVGHTGTLDPLATGVLLLAVGPATRLVEFSHAAGKTYDGLFELGLQSDSLDIESEVRPVPDGAVPNQGQLEAELENWTGVVEQIPPKFSAINIQGRRAHELARAGEDFSIPSRQVTIERIRLTDFEFPKFRLIIQCGTGTYIRTLGSDVARALGTDCVMCELTRTAIGTVSVADCVDLGSLQTLEEVEKRLLSPIVLLEHLAQVVLAEEGCRKIRNGIAISASEFLEPPPTSEPITAISQTGQLVAVLSRKGSDTYRSLRVFQNTSDTIHPMHMRLPQSPES